MPRTRKKKASSSRSTQNPSTSTIKTQNPSPSTSKTQNPALLTNKTESPPPSTSKTRSVIDDPPVTYNETSSSDEEIQTSNETSVLPDSNGFGDFLEGLFLGLRDLIVDSSGNIGTPLTALQITALALSVEVHYKFYQFNSGESKLHVVEIFAGQKRGLGECCRKKMAIQIAAADLLDKIGNQGGYVIPAYGMLPGCRINPKILGDLAALCEKLKCGAPKYIRIIPGEWNADEPRFKFTCRVDNVDVLGHSDSMYLAKRWAAKKMYEILSSKRVKLDRICRGCDCRASRRFGIIVAASERKKETMRNQRDSSWVTSIPEGETNYWVDDLDLAMDEVEFAIEKDIINKLMKQLAVIRAKEPKLKMD